MGEVLLFLIFDCILQPVHEIDDLISNKEQEGQHEQRSGLEILNIGRGNILAEL